MLERRGTSGRWRAIPGRRSPYSLPKRGEPARNRCDSSEHSAFALTIAPRNSGKRRRFAAGLRAHTRRPILAVHLDHEAHLRTVCVRAEFLWEDASPDHIWRGDVGTSLAGGNDA